MVFIRFKKALLDAAGAAVCLLLLPFLYVAEIFWRIRIGELVDDRIGHIAFNTEAFLRRLELKGRPPRTTYVFLSFNPANRSLVRMIGRRVPVLESKIVRRLFIGARPIFTRTRFFAPIPFFSSEHYELSVGRPQLSFTESEDRRGQAFLRSVGLQPTDWFICIHARTPAYLAAKVNQPPHNSFRDCSIANYMKAAQWAIEQGGWVFRMGSIDMTPMTFSHPRLVDYANTHRDDFLDVYLSAKCRMYLGNTSGLVGIPLIFNVPSGLANYVELFFSSLGGHTLYIPKLLRDPDGSFVPFRDVAGMGLMAWPENSDIRRRMTDRHQALFDRWEENSADDIRDLCMDVFDMIAGRPASEEARRLQDAYRAFFGDSPSASPHAGRIGPRFALKYRHLIEA